MSYLRIAFVFLLFFFIPHSVSAHSAGYPPFFKIEGEIAETYPLSELGVFSTTLEVPQDTAPKNYVVGEKIPFEIDTEILNNVFPSEVAEKIKYKWDFGDGTKSEGTKKEYAYKKPGSYILTITADYHDPATPPQLIESVLIHILPNRDYKLPQAIIKANDKKGTKEDYNIIDFDLNNRLHFDASESVASSSKIVKFTWDFGDDNSEEGKTATHQYQLPQAFATVILRVEDENGFFADAYVNIRNSGSNEPNNPLFGGLEMIAGPILVAVIAGILGFFLRKRKNSKKKY